MYMAGRKAGRVFARFCIPAKGEPMHLRDVAEAADFALQRGVDLQIRGRTFRLQYYRASHVPFIEIGDFKFVAQNPKKNTRFADAQRDGLDITWIFENGHYMHGPDGTPGVVGGHFVESLHEAV